MHITEVLYCNIAMLEDLKTCTLARHEPTIFFPKAVATPRVVPM
jgi:hypothetical protein